ncbi:pentapeptide repeat-containing protein [Hoeflea sp. TYP-13]|uniref:pentapeptide repeat-containing protein n=1 Tax=Hoeflea sp. TYP-13 TaxID=3230023 RepID=UPI0034C62109
MPETLLSASNIVLFGRVVEDISIVTPKGNKSHSPSVATSKGTSSGLQQQLTRPDWGDFSAGTREKLARFARIYGFSYEGAYFEVGVPVLFLVHGDGVAPASLKVPGPDPDDKNFYNDLRAWSYDRGDETMRLDIDSGTFEQVLLSTIGEGGPGVSGARVSGARVSGARVSGARVSGARVSGARVSGARISGARGDAGD